MRIPTAILTVLCTLVAVNASNPHDSLSLSARHAKLARREPPLERKSIVKRCTRRTKNTTTTTTTQENKAAALVKDTTTSATHTTAAAAVATASAKTTSSNNGASGTISVSSSCGPSGATKKTTTTCGPNGCIDWLNCGVTNGGWSPPYVRVQDVITQSLSTAITASGSPFKACSSYVWIFEKYGGQYGIPAIMLASFAMQESSCNPNTVGGAGEQGLMQITKEKCVGAPGGNCQDPEFNIQTGAKFFSDTLSSNNGDLLVSLGMYNGWYRGLTYSKATAAAKTSCCRCQNNLDYLHQFLNGWCQNIDAYNQNFRLGKFFNLDVCG